MCAVYTLHTREKRVEVCTSGWCSLQLTLYRQCCFLIGEFLLEIQQNSPSCLADKENNCSELVSPTVLNIHCTLSVASESISESTRFVTVSNELEQAICSKRPANSKVKKMKIQYLIFSSSLLLLNL